MVVRDADEAVDTYRELLGDPSSAAELGRRARERVLEEHTFAHRARRLLDLLGLREPAAVRG
jgi:spore maturation protein CgeB